MIKFNDKNYSAVCTDTRAYKRGELFVAISGENFNAFEYIDTIANKGVETVIYTKTSENQALKKQYENNFNQIDFIEVENSITFLQGLAQGHRERLGRENPDLRVISISGSNGKTTCKEILRHLLKDYEVVATERNDNNHLGVPLTILRMSESTQFLVIELGSNHPGEIPLLTKISSPDISYVTNIGYTHMEFFPTLDDVFKEESYPLLHTGTAFINVDDNYLKKLDLNNSVKIGESIESFQCSQSSVMINSLEISNPKLLGKHNYHNLGAMLEVAIYILGEDSFEVLSQNAQSFSPGLMRSEWREINNRNIFLDAYNANPSSMSLAAESFIHHVKDKSIDANKVVLIIGDMKELGDGASQLHTETAQKISKALSGYQIQAVFIGDHRGDYQKGWNGECFRFVNLEKFIEDQLFNEILSGKTYVFLKASRSLQFEKILDKI